MKDEQAHNTPYQDAGFINRTEYLESLAEDYGLPIRKIRAIADLYGPSEDFDGPIAGIIDYLDDDQNA